MKRLILMGGRPWLAADEGRRFVDALFRYFSKEVKVGFCIFAQPESDWDETVKWNLKLFNKFGDGRNVLHKVMTSENFAEVSAWADVIYLPGGDPFVLVEKMKAFGDAAKLWDGKVVAGSSAGADLLCDGFIALGYRKFGRGLGWAKASCVPHWRAEDFKEFAPADWGWAEQECLRHLPDSPVITIPEGDFVELTVK